MLLKVFRTDLAWEVPIRMDAFTKSECILAIDENQTKGILITNLTNFDIFPSCYQTDFSSDQSWHT